MARGRLMLSSGHGVEGHLLCPDAIPKEGELVFTTSSTGYVETLTDPSYYGQIVVFAHPMIGNYGVNPKDFQSDRIQARAVVVRNLIFSPSSDRSSMTFVDWCMKENIPVLYGIDTRALIVLMRDHGPLDANLVSAHASLSKPMIEQMPGKRLSQFVQTKGMAVFENPASENKLQVVVLDFGVKKSIIDNLRSLFYKVSIVSGESSIEAIWALKPDGILLSNGPGDPNLEVFATNTIKALLGKVPIFGICLGHQLLAQALGLETYKLSYGHRGSNHSVRLLDNRIWITAQNHGYAVKNRDYQADMNITDNTNEGLSLPDLMAFSCQYHPEGAPGPKDAAPLFQQFFQLVTEFKANQGSVYAQNSKVRNKEAELSF